MTAARTAWSVGGAPVSAEVPAEWASVVACFFPDDRITAAGPAAGRPPDLAMAPSGPAWRLVEAGPEGRARKRAGGTAAGVLAALELALAERLARSRPGFRVLHAGGAVGARGALLLPGAGGSGKSTLAAALARAGLPLLGDDAVLLEAATGAAHPFRRSVKLLPPSCAALGVAAPRGALAELWPDAAFFHPRALGAQWAAPARPAAVVFPTWDPSSAAASLRPLDAGEAMRRLLAQLLLPAGGGAPDFDLLAGAVQDARTAELRYRDATEAVAVLAALVG